MYSSIVPLWKEAPFVRLLIPLTVGIIVQYYCPFDWRVWILLIVVMLLSIVAINRSRLSTRFRHPEMYGISFHVLWIAFGAAITAWNDNDNRAQMISELLSSRSLTWVSVASPPSPRPASYKTICEVMQIDNGKMVANPGTNIIVYFKKNTGALAPEYGQEYLLYKLPERIRNRVGADFDYERFCAFSNIYYQVFAGPANYRLIRPAKRNLFSASMYSLRQWIVWRLRRDIDGKKEYGLAAALLIGYKDDLDKQLIRSYANTGVVHVVAISGLHLSLVYGLLGAACKPLRRRKYGRIIAVAVILSGLWGFSLLAGGGPSVVRSAVMFTFIAAGQLIDRRVSIGNNLAASAFFLLCYDPFWLWDIGFQLSYAALLSIVLFMKPIYHLLALKNPLLDSIWKLNAVTLAAQVLTAPLCVFYFHQFPMVFLLTNIIAVPLSGIILLGEIALCILAPLPFLTAMLGSALKLLLSIMNGWVEMLGGFSFSSVTGLDISLWQTIAVYGAIAAMAVWLVLKRSMGAVLALVACILFMVVRFN